MVRLEGTVIRKPWTKTFESWDAGGSEYYVLDVEDPETRRRGIILRPTDAVAFETIAGFAGKNVVIRGERLVPQPHVPVHQFEPYPVGADGKPADRGSGIAVYEISELRP